MPRCRLADGDPTPRDTSTARTSVVHYALAIAVLAAAVRAFQFVGRPLWCGAIDSDRARSRGLAADSGWLLDETRERMVRSPRPVSDGQLRWLHDLSAGDHANARLTLAQLDGRQGLPDDLIRKIEEDLAATGDRRRTAALCVLGGVRHRMIDGTALAATMRGQDTQSLRQISADETLQGVIRAAASAELLARGVGPEDTTATIEDGLSSTDPEQRRSALESLTQLARVPPGEAAVVWRAALVRALGDPDARVRMAAIDASCFAPLLPQEKAALRDELLESGSDLKKLGVLQMLFSYEAGPSPALRAKVLDLAGSDNA